MAPCVPLLMIGVRMVTTEEIADIAARYDTQIARAFRKALGIRYLVASICRPVRRLVHAMETERRKYEGIRECMAGCDDPGAWREARRNQR
ncbi:MAG: hypothetical protein SO366_02895 [Atopobiaceae bacterium]|nr:hypothetical protein [Atopobiaceae bacterium]